MAEMLIGVQQTAAFSPLGHVTAMRILYTVVVGDYDLSDLAKRRANGQSRLAETWPDPSYRQSAVS